MRDVNHDRQILYKGKQVKIKKKMAVRDSWSSREFLTCCSLGRMKVESCFTTLLHSKKDSAFLLVTFNLLS